MNDMRENEGTKGRTQNYHSPRVDDDMPPTIFDQRATPELTYADVFRRYRNSELGQFHADQDLRYSQDWAYERHQMLADLGPDAHPVEHMVVVHGILRQVLYKDAYTEGHAIPRKTIKSMLLGALIHDVGENEHPFLVSQCGGVVGDIRYGKKNAEQRLLEEKIITTILENTFPELDEVTLESTLSLVMHREESDEHRLFDRAHTLSFFFTALRARKIASRLDDTTPRYQKLMGLHDQVIGNIYPRLESEAELSPSIREALAAYDSNL